MTVAAVILLKNTVITRNSNRINHLRGCRLRRPPVGGTGNSEDPYVFLCSPPRSAY